MLGIDFGPHDPTPWGWLIVGVYLLAAAFSVGAGLTRRRMLGGPARLEWFWYAFAIALVLLAINKQLDLQTELSHFGKSLAWEQGWYRDRQIVQTWFVRAVGAGAVAAGVALVVLYRRGSIQHWIAIAGFVALLAFIAVRAASLHDIDAILFTRRAADLNASRALELGGALVLAAAAIWAALAPSRSPAAPPPPRRGSPPLAHAPSPGER